MRKYNKNKILERNILTKKERTSFTRFKTPCRFSAYINETGCSIIYSIYIILEQIVSYKYVCIRF